MFREKLVTTLVWAALFIGGTMAADYGITILLLHDLQAYTPLITLSIALAVTLPATYILVSGRIELRHARDALATARDAALEADKAKTQFFSNMSHELRTPLNAIIGFSEMLGSDLFASKRVEYAHLIHNSGQHLLSLVNDLLDLSRIEAGRLELKDEVLDFADLADACAETIATRVRARALRLVRDVDADLPLLRADRRALTQILLNLLTNAVKFTNPGGTVEVFARLDPAGVPMFGVRDEGIGISQDNLKRVFERFAQARHDIVGIENGTGLGLPIVKGLTEAHGGRIAMTSQIGQGTCVTIWLPRERIVTRPAIAKAS